MKSATTRQGTRSRQRKCSPLWPIVMAISPEWMKSLLQCCRLRPVLKVISRYGVGVDRIDLEEARRLGIAVTNTPGANSSSVADLTVGLLLSLARQIPQAVQAVRAGSWPRINGISLEGKNGRPAWFRVNWAAGRPQTAGF